MSIYESLSWENMMEYWVSEIINTLLFVVMMWAWLTILFMVFG